MVNNKLHSRGFTLIELSIVMLVAGVIMAGIITLLSINNESKANLTTIKRLDRIQEALAAYVHENGYLPCPAVRTQAMNTASYNTSSVCPTVTTGTTDSGGVRIGTLPTREIHLPDRYGLDGWSNKFTYAVVIDLAQSTTLYNSYTTSDTDGVIQILDSSGSQILDNTAANPVVAYAIVSHGRDGKGSTTSNGGPNGATCDATIQDGENCDNDEVFVDTEINDLTNVDADFFDDYIRWETRTGVTRASEIYNQ